jgi:ribonuclease R
VGVEEFGLFCRLTELPVDGLIHVSSLADDYYYLESGTHTLVGRRSGRRHRLGDRALVRIAHVDVDRRELDLVLEQMPLARGRTRRTAPSPSPVSSRPGSGPPRSPRQHEEAGSSPKPGDSKRRGGGSAASRPKKRKRRGNAR